MRSGLCKRPPGDVDDDADAIGSPRVESWGNCFRWGGNEEAVLPDVSWLLLLLKDWKQWNGSRIGVDADVGSAEDEDDVNPNCAPAMLDSPLKWLFSSVDMG